MYAKCSQPLEQFDLRNESSAKNISQVVLRCTTAEHSFQRKHLTFKLHLVLQILFSSLSADTERDCHALKRNSILYALKYRIVYQRICSRQGVCRCL